jgi:hypothetical protein
MKTTGGKQSRELGEALVRPAGNTEERPWSNPLLQ